MTSSWINNAYWLRMAFRRKDSGVTLTHKGASKTMDGAAAAVLVNRAPDLVEEWAFYEKAADP